MHTKDPNDPQRVTVDPVDAMQLPEGYPQPGQEIILRADVGPRPDYLRLRPLLVKYYGPTNHTGARIRIRDGRGIIKSDLWLHRDYDVHWYGDQARGFLLHMGWPIEGHLVEDPENGLPHVLLTRAFKIDSWTDATGEADAPCQWRERPWPRVFDLETGARQ